MGNDFSDMIESWGDAKKAYQDFKTNNPSLWRKIKLGAAAGVIGLGALVTGLASFYTVGPTEEGLVTRFGKYVHSTTPGPHFKIPLVDKVDFVEITTVRKQEFGFRTKKAGVQTTYVQKDYPEESLMLTGDHSIVDLEFVVQYKVKNAADYTYNVRNPDETLRDAAEAAMRMEVGDRGIDDILTSGKKEIQIAVQERLQSIVDEYKSGILIMNINLQDVFPPKSVAVAFKDVNKARQQRTQKVNEGWAEYNRVIPKIKGQAQKMVRTSEAYALKRVNEAEGDAKKFKDVYERYKEAPEITRRRMYLETLTKIMPGFKEKIIIDDSSNGVLKLLNLNPEGGNKK